MSHLNEFSIQQLRTVLQSPELSIYPQAIIFKVIEQWYTYNRPAREAELRTLVSSLRLVEFDLDFLVTKIKPLPGCGDLVEKAMQEREKGNSWLMMRVWGLVSRQMY